GRSARVTPDTNVAPDNCVAIGLDRFDRIGRAHQPEVAAFADHDASGEPKDAGKRDVEIGQDPRPARPDYVLEEAGIIARPGASSIDERGDAAFFGEVVGIDSQRDAAPINGGVEVDEAPCKDHAAVLV